MSSDAEEKDRDTVEKSKLMYQGSEGIRMCSERVKSDKGLELILFCGTHDICV